MSRNADGILIRGADGGTYFIPDSALSAYKVDTGVSNWAADLFDGDLAFRVKTPISLGLAPNDDEATVVGFDAGRARKR